MKFSDLRSKAFGNTWLALAGGDSRTGPLKDFVTLMETASGTILEIGPGDGRQVKYFTGTGIKNIYGAEPCVPLHGPLKQAVKEAGLDEKYHVMACGGERATLVPALAELGLLKSGQKGVFDTIISSKVFCSMPDPNDTALSLYGLLKPGGRLLFCEHVKNPWRTPKGSLVARLIQAFFMLIGWTYFLGGCHLDRDTMRVFREVAEEDGGWESVNVEAVGEYGAIPFIFGEAVKRS